MKTVILLIEPDKQQAKLISDFLTRYEVVWAPSGHHAIKMLETLNPNIIVSEHLFANHNSFEFLYELRSYPEWQTLPFILFSSVFLSDAVQKNEVFEQLGIDSYLYKPQTSMAELQNQIQRTVYAAA